MSSRREPLKAVYAAHSWGALVLSYWQGYNQRGHVGCHVAGVTFVSAAHSWKL